VLELTGDGRMLATILLRNIRVAVQFLEALAVDAATVHTDAEQCALVMSDDVAEALSELLDGWLRYRSSSSSHGAERRCLRHSSSGGTSETATMRPMMGRM
jgi:Mn-dependent DtxR family transcriptional regulator